MRVVVLALFDHRLLSNTSNIDLRRATFRAGAHLLRTGPKLLEMPKLLDSEPVIASSIGATYQLDPGRFSGAADYAEKSSRASAGAVGH